MHAPNDPGSLDTLLNRLRHDAGNVRTAPVSSILENLGLSARERRRLIRAGLCASCVALFAAVLVASGVSKRERSAAPPALTLITQGSGPLASL